MESCVLEQPIAAAASCRSVLPQGSAVVFSHLGERGSSGEEEAMGGQVHTSDFHLLLSSGQKE